MNQVMTPFAGQGVNLAMQDAFELAHLVIQKQEDLVNAIREYEEGMFERAARSAFATKAGLDMAFNTNAPQGLVDFFSSLHLEEAEAIE